MRTVTLTTEKILCKVIVDLDEKRKRGNRMEKLRGSKSDPDMILVGRHFQADLASEGW